MNDQVTLVNLDDLQGARFSFNVSSSPLGLVIGYDGVNIDE